MSTTPRLLSLATAVPPYLLQQEEVARAAEILFADDYADFSRLAPVFANAEIESRYSCVPLEWYLEPHEFSERNELYVENAVELLGQVATRALAAAGLPAHEIDVLLTVSSTGIATPSLDALLMERLPFRRDVARLPVFGLGCVGGVLGLGRAAALALARPESRVLLLVVELCGLTFRRNDRTKSNVIATALFGDGAAGAVISCAGAGPELVAWGEHTWPGTLDVMGWDVLGDGLAVVFSRDIPAIVRQRFAGALAAFLERHRLTLADIDAFCCHPGGAKVLDALEEVFGSVPGGLEAARKVLRRYGNMSAATVMFVLQEILRRPAEAGGRRSLVSSLGPGFSAGFAVLQEA